MNENFKINIITYTYDIIEDTQDWPVPQYVSTKN